MQKAVAAGGMIKALAALQLRMAQIQKEIAAQVFEGSSGAGAVIVTVDGKHQVLKVVVSPDVAGESAETLGGLFFTAMGDANAKAEAFSKVRLDSLKEAMQSAGMGGFAGFVGL